MDSNKVSLIGKVAQSPVSRTLSNGQSVARFNLAVGYVLPSRKGPGTQIRTDHHNVLAWGKLAEIIGHYLKKGSKVYVEGRLQNRLWTDNSGKRKTQDEVVADELILLGNKRQ